MLHLPIDEIRLELPLRTPPIQHKSSRLRILRGRRTTPPPIPRILCRTLIPQDREPLCARDGHAIPDMITFDEVVDDGPAGDYGVGVVRPAGHADVNATFDVGAEGGDGVVVDAGVGIVSLPGVDIDEVDTWKPSNQ